MLEHAASVTSLAAADVGDAVGVGAGVWTGVLLGLGGAGVVVPLLTLPTWAAGAGECGKPLHPASTARIAAAPAISAPVRTPDMRSPTPLVVTSLRLLPLALCRPGLNTLVDDPGNHHARRAEGDLRRTDVALT